MQPSNEDEFEFSDSPPTSVNKRTRSRARRCRTVYIEYQIVSARINRVSPSSAKNNNEYLFRVLYFVSTTHCTSIYLFTTNIFDGLRQQSRYISIPFLQQSSTLLSTEKELLVSYKSYPYPQYRKLSNNQISSMPRSLL